MFGGTHGTLEVKLRDWKLNMWKMIRFPPPFPPSYSSSSCRSVYRVTVLKIDHSLRLGRTAEFSYSEVYRGGKSKMRRGAEHSLAAASLNVLTHSLGDLFSLLTEISLEACFSSCFLIKVFFLYFGVGCWREKK